MAAISIVFLFSITSCTGSEEVLPDFETATTLYSFFSDAEPFGIAEKDGIVYVSDGKRGRLLAIEAEPGACLNPLGCYRGPRTITDKLITPSHIAVDADGTILVADSGDHTVKRVSTDGKIEIVAGKQGEAGFSDGGAGAARFRAPVGIAVRDGKIFVTDSYNDRIRLIEEGNVRTLAGSKRGFKDSQNGSEARFDTPSGIEVLPDGSLLVADLGNRRLRLVAPDGRTTTYAGNGYSGVRDGRLLDASFSSPTDVVIGKGGEVFVADGDTIRVIGARAFPIVETLTDTIRGFSDGDSRKSRFNRASGIVVGSEGDVFVTDADNHMVRVLGGRLGKPVLREAFEKIMDFPFDAGAPPMRWPYDPPNAVREIAGTFGEVRGERDDSGASVYFHNGLDITGAYGETARFVKDEKVLEPDAVQNVGTLRELIRLPWLAYIHVNIGRETDETAFDDPRFLIESNNGHAVSVRVPRGTAFKAGEPVGTLNRMNHVHLVVGYPGRELNGFGALSLPGVGDSRDPVIERIALYRENWSPIETSTDGGRISVNGRVRVVADAYDQMDGNADRRRLGVYAVGYKLLDSEGRPFGAADEETFNMVFYRLPDPDLAAYVFAPGSRSGATGPTVFRYIATNRLIEGRISEGFINFEKLPQGDYEIEVSVRDYKGNTSTRSIAVRAE